MKTDYSIIFQKLELAKDQDPGAAAIAMAICQDEDIQEFIAIIDQFEEDQQPPVYSAT